MYYIGELDSAATEISGPILNVAGDSAGQSLEHLRRADLGLRGA